MSTDHERETYDKMYEEGGYEGTYDLPYRRSCYYPLFAQVARQLRERRSQRVLEVGCGNGALAQLLMDRYPVTYRGFDFSAVAVAKARKVTSNDELFFVGDARDPASYAAFEYDTIVCTEVLEHVEADRDIVSAWSRGAFCVCSVPNFDATTHVRYFEDERVVRQRYEDLIDIRKIRRIRKPALSDIGWRSRARELRWARYNPKRLRNLLGLGSFSVVGGWFLLVGTRR
jgi:SAM-dependent methyltransferase